MHSKSQSTIWLTFKHSQLPPPSPLLTRDFHTAIRFTHVCNLAKQKGTAQTGIRVLCWPPLHAQCNVIPLAESRKPERRATKKININRNILHTHYHSDKQRHHCINIMFPVLDSFRCSCVCGGWREVGESKEKQPKPRNDDGDGIEAK